MTRRRSICPKKVDRVSGKGKLNLGVVEKKSLVAVAKREVKYLAATVVGIHGTELFALMGSVGTPKVLPSAVS